MSEPDQQADSGRFKRLDQAELDKILESHAKFVGGRSGGQRANLGSYDLSYLDLSGKNLSNAELSGSRMANWVAWTPTAIPPAPASR